MTVTSGSPGLAATASLAMSLMVPPPSATTTSESVVASIAACTTLSVTCSSEWPSERTTRRTSKRLARSCSTIAFTSTPSRYISVASTRSATRAGGLHPMGTRPATASTTRARTPGPMTRSVNPHGTSRPSLSSAATNARTSSSPASAGALDKIPPRDCAGVKASDRARFHNRSDHVRERSLGFEQAHFANRRTARHDAPTT